MDTGTAIDELWKKHTHVRDVFPPVPESKIGSREISSGEWFKQQGLGSTRAFDRPLTKDDVGHLNSIAHWLNQSFVIRLVAAMQALGIQRGKFDRRIDCLADVEIAFDLRDILAHGNGQYIPNRTYGDRNDQKTERELYERISMRYGLNLADADTPGDWHLPINQVLEHLMQRCREYAIEFIKT